MDPITRYSVWAEAHHGALDALVLELTSGCFLQRDAQVVIGATLRGDADAMFGRVVQL